MALNLNGRSKEWLAARQRWVRCTACSRLMELKNTSYGVAYVCPGCETRHGAHQKTGEPLGTPAPDKETRQARVDAHEALDALWMGPDAPMTRAEAYAYLAERAGLTPEECHIGRFTKEQCRAAIAICEEVER